MPKLSGNVCAQGVCASFGSFWARFLLVSALPIGLYHRQVLQLSQDKLVDQERVQQTDLTRSLAQEIQQFESSLTQQLLSERQILVLTGLIDNVEDPAAEPKVTRLLEDFVESNRSTFHLLDGRWQVRKRHERLTGKFPGGAGSFRRASVATSLCDLHAIASSSRWSSSAAIRLRWRLITVLLSSSRCL